MGIKTEKIDGTRILNEYTSSIDLKIGDRFEVE